LSVTESGIVKEAEGIGADGEGRRGFDFLFGKWRIANRKQADPLTTHSTEWLEFEATSEERPILGGLGNVETYSAPAFPGRKSFEALALRLFEPETGLWRIWWTSTVRPGILEVPVIGRFVDGHGQFECDEVNDFRPLKVRFDWKSITASSARWEQAFSFDAGQTWVTNWIMELTREA
jgi:hypothetical protein